VEFVGIGVKNGWTGVNNGEQYDSFSAAIFCWADGTGFTWEMGGTI